MSDMYTKVDSKVIRNRDYTLTPSIYLTIVIQIVTYLLFANVVSYLPRKTIIKEHVRQFHFVQFTIPVIIVFGENIMP